MVQRRCGLCASAECACVALHAQARDAATRKRGTRKRRASAGRASEHVDARAAQARHSAASAREHAQAAREHVDARAAVESALTLNARAAASARAAAVRMERAPSAGKRSCRWRRQWSDSRPRRCWCRACWPWMSTMEAPAGPARQCSLGRGRQQQSSLIDKEMELIFLL